MFSHFRFQNGVPVMLTYIVQTGISYSNSMLGKYFLRIESFLEDGIP